MPHSTSSAMMTSSAFECLPNELLLKIMSQVIMSSAHASDPLAPSTPDSSILQIDSDSHPAAPGPVTDPRTASRPASPASGKWTASAGMPEDIHTLCVTSRSLHELANTVIYRCVVLQTEKSVLLFARTVASLVNVAKSMKQGTRPTLTLEFLQNTVKRIAVTFVPQLFPIFGFFRPQNKAVTKVTASVVASILSACSGARTVAVASDWSACFKDVEALEGGKSECRSRSLTELVLGSYTELGYTQSTWPPIPQWRPSAPSTPVPSRPSSPINGFRNPSERHPDELGDQILESPIPFLSSVTHLRIAEPQASLGWHSPLSLLSLFPKLTHVSLPRRCGANVENDFAFLEGVKTCLRKPSMKMVVVVLFAPQTSFAAVRDDNSADGEIGEEKLEQMKTSSIWESVQELKRHDKRLFVIPASYGSWKREWQSIEAQASASGPGDWWSRVRS
ncbi:hypothetical protein HYDPIDRAFT_27245 [Hydnomerulius pinastri MD-312]|nr:hypothetical protein HYDPIDRAFT_27245 [Hydnomerulius pinastri MD-312]